mmetsp:Transcript_10589/g.41152  ORF Transcript_10589/g.41152 Transcript_10589/m.41152 type:complete len:312 (+) Transcript_10589:791-1726(+)
MRPAGRTSRTPWLRCLRTAPRPTTATATATRPSTFAARSAGSTACGSCSGTSATPTSRTLPTALPSARPGCTASAARRRCSWRSSCRWSWTRPAGPCAAWRCSPARRRSWASSSQSRTPRPRPSAKPRLGALRLVGQPRSAGRRTRLPRPRERRSSPPTAPRWRWSQPPRARQRSAARTRRAPAATARRSSVLGRGARRSGGSARPEGSPPLSKAMPCSPAGRRTSTLRATLQPGAAAVELLQASKRLLLRSRRPAGAMPRPAPRRRSGATRPAAALMPMRRGPRRRLLCFGPGLSGLNGSQRLAPAWARL